MRFGQCETVRGPFWRDDPRRSGRWSGVGVSLEVPQVLVQPHYKTCRPVVTAFSAYASAAPTSDARLRLKRGAGRLVHL